MFSARFLRILCCDIIFIYIPGNPPRGDRNQRPKCLRRPGRSVGHVERSISGRSITQLDLPGRAQVGQSSMSNGRVQLNRSGRSNHSVRSCQWVRSIGPVRSVGHVGQPVMSARSARSARSATSVSSLRSSVGHVGQIPKEKPAALVQRGCSQGGASSFHPGHPNFLVLQKCRPKFTIEFGFNCE